MFRTGDLGRITADGEVERIARDPALFSYLADSEATVRTTIGDGRLALSRRPRASYDMIVLDAFSSDSIPVHLMTREAIEMYASRLKPGGVLMFHISNRVFDLVNRVGNARPSLVPRLNAVSARALGERRYRDVPHRVFTTRRTVRFREMEYAVPRAAGLSALAEVRATVGGLRAGNLDAELAAAPQVLADAGIETRVVGSVADTDPRHRTLLAWVLREAVTNVVRHARASCVVVELGPRGITVTDDGHGANGGASGHGLVGMRERVALYGGELQAGPGPEGGYQVAARLPFRA